MVFTLHPITDADMPEVGHILDSAYGRQGMIARLAKYRTIQDRYWCCLREDAAIIAVGGAVNYGPYAAIGLIGTHH